jgi:actin-like ATPase involved in cell morphogenesis
MGKFPDETWINGKKSIGKMLGFLSHDIDIDLGTVNTLVFAKDHSIIMNEYSFVANSKQVYAVGAEAMNASSNAGRHHGQMTDER